MKYYRLIDDIEYPNRWYLGDISNYNNWDLTHHVPNTKETLKIALYRDGNEMDFTLSEVYGVPIVSEKLKYVLFNYSSDITFIPVNIEQKLTKSNYYAMIILNTVECVDESNSIFNKFKENDPVRPDKAGEYRAFIKLRLNTSKITGTNLFRLNKAETYIIINEEIKDRLEGIGITGVDLIAV